MIVISLTSYKERLKYVPRVIESLLDQSVKADKIVLTLWRQDLPYMNSSLKTMEERGDFELHVVEEDLKPHKKYFYTMLRYPGAVVITVDDDHVYRHDLVEILTRSYAAHPGCVSACRVHRIHWTEDGEVAPYASWDKEFTGYGEPSFELLATGVGGVLYPPDILKITEDNLPDVRRCITADDIYLKWLENKYGVKVVWAPSDKPYGGKKIWWAQHQRRALWRVNKGSSGLNDEYLRLFKIEKKQD